MFKLLAFLSFFLPSVIGFAPATETAICDCPSPTNLQKTGQTSTSFTYAWSSPYPGAKCRIWYVRQEDGYSSGYMYTNSTSHTFAGLGTGHYTFYVQTWCEEEASGYIGIEDTIGV